MSSIEDRINYWYFFFLYLPSYVEKKIAVMLFTISFELWSILLLIKSFSSYINVYSVTCYYKYTQNTYISLNKIIGLF